MSSLKNSVQLIGNLGKDLEIKVLENGRALARTTIATNETYKNKSGQQVTDTQWHNLTAWGRTAENMAKMLKKGNGVMVKGKLNHSSYEDTQGNIRYYSTIVVNEFVVLNKSDRA